MFGVTRRLPIEEWTIIRIACPLKSRCSIQMKNPDSPQPLVISLFRDEVCCRCHRRMMPKSGGSQSVNRLHKQKSSRITLEARISKIPARVIARDASTSEDAIARRRASRSTRPARKSNSMKRPTATMSTPPNSRQLTRPRPRPLRFPPEPSLASSRWSSVRSLTTGG